jgi:hypothetical protein
VLKIRSAGTIFGGTDELIALPLVSVDWLSIFATLFLDASTWSFWGSSSTFLTTFLTTFQTTFQTTFRSIFHLLAY